MVSLNMSDVFIERRLFTNNNGIFSDTTIFITKPIEASDGLYYCNILFSNVKKYNTISKGIDQFNAIDCALEYVSKICSISEIPEFFISRNESMKGFFDVD